MDVPFSKRFENIITISKKLSVQGQDAATAKSQAQDIEGQFLGIAEGADGYQQLCDDYIRSAHGDEEDSKLGPDEDSSPTEIFNSDGPTFGAYTWATYRADGRTSTIYKAKAVNDAADDKVVALKLMIPSHLEPPHNAQREVRVLQKARHANIVPLLDTFQQPGGKLILVFPFLRQDLENLLRTETLTQAQSKMVFEGLFGALAHIHSLGIIHRDVKPSNILLKSVDGPVYLIDFGIVWADGDADSEDGSSKITDVGTTCYRPPEILFGDRSYGTSLDMWAAGCVIAEIVRKGHYQLFDAGDLGSELALIKSIFTTLGTPNENIWPSAKQYPDWGKIRFQDFPARPWNEILSGATGAAFDFVAKTVCYEPTARLTAEQALRHPLAESLGQA